MNFKPTITLAICCIALALTSCSEHDAESEYDNWTERNQHYIDSIAHEAEVNADGTWLRIKAYNIGDDEALYLDQTNNFIYARRITTATSDRSPLYNDTIRMHYSGRLIPTAQHPAGYCFGKSYSTQTLNLQTDVPTKFGVNTLTKGVATAVMNMHEGDRWMVYIPYTLGYGKSEYTSASIPPYSTLVFDIHLARVYHLKVDTDTSWY